ncbi:MAG: apolipoprotein N-acyltransferase [Chlorobium sp.]|nr:MAG: apolipoprotein N-acyltransferase [Chlorobium sp.]
MTSLSRTINQLSQSRYAAPLLSGLFLGISFPSYPFIRFELLAWVALVPLLLSLRTVESAGELFRRVYLSMLLYCLISLWWVSLATLPGGILTMLTQACFLTVPFLAFYAIKKMAGYRFALFSLPFLWVAWEWAYMQQDLSLGWLTFGNSQANLNYMIQYADLTGVWGISFWLLWFNICVVMALEGNKKERLRYIVIMMLMILAPLIYASVMFLRQGVETPSSRDTLRVTLVQPNVDPHGKWEPNSSADIMERYYRITDKAVRENRPDLVIWPETAILFSILEPPFADDLRTLRLSLRQWNAALLTGFIDVLHNRNRSTGIYNASMLLEPGNEAPRIYRKMHLVPFAERVPYIDYFPWLGYATFSLSGLSGWERGADTAIMKLSASGKKVVVADFICYESIFPAHVAEFVRKGARVLTLVTNDGWYFTSYGPYQHLAIGRLRCIENRRAIARCANTGLTVVLDKFGRTIAEIPWWKAETLTADVPLENSLTFYTRYPDLLPKSASVISAVLFLAAFFKKKTRDFH